MKTLFTLLILLFIAFMTYSIAGTQENVETIKSRAPDRLKEAHFTILRYDGYQRGSWEHHGGKVWYHVAEESNPAIRYRVYVTYWGGETHLYYGAPENVSNIQLDVKKN